jgi:hypothetical protein
VILLSLASAHVYCHFLSAADEVWHGFAYRFDARLMGGVNPGLRATTSMSNFFTTVVLVLHLTFESRFLTGIIITAICTATHCAAFE